VTEQTVAFDYAETGSGPALLFLPGASARARAGKRSWGISVTVTAWSRQAYWATEPRQTSDLTAMHHGAASRPHRPHHRPDRHVPHVVGHSYGGLSAIVHGLDRPTQAREPAARGSEPLGLLRASGDLEHYGMFESMTGPYFADFARAIPRRPGTSSTSTAVRAPSIRCLQRSAATSSRPTAVNLRDWSSGTPFEPARRSCSRSMFRRWWFAEETVTRPCAELPSFCTLQFLWRSLSRSKAGITFFQQPSCRDRRTDSATRRWKAGDVRLDVRPRGPEAMFPI